MNNKTKMKITLILICVLTSIASAEDKKMEYEKLLTFEKVKIIKILPSGIRIMHSGGITTIPIENLPDDVRDNLGLNNEKAEEYRKNVAEVNKAKAKKAKMAQILAKERLIFMGSVFQVLDGGLLIRGVRYTDGHTKEEKKTAYKVKTGGPTGLYPNRKYKHITRYRSKWVLKVRSMDTWPIYVECDTAGYVDGSDFTSAVYADGIYDYTNVQRAKKTIPAYTTSPAKMLKRKGY